MLLMISRDINGPSHRPVQLRDDGSRRRVRTLACSLLLIRDRVDILMRERDAFGSGLAESIGMQVAAAFGFGLRLLDRDSMSIGVGVLSYAGNLPGNLHSGRAAGDLEAVVGNLFRDMQIRPGSAYGGELVTKILVERPEPCREDDHCLSGRVKPSHAVLDILHIRGFHERVVKVFVLRVDWMIDLERSSAL